MSEKKSDGQQNQNQSRNPQCKEEKEKFPNRAQSDDETTCSEYIVQEITVIGDKPSKVSEAVTETVNERLLIIDKGERLRMIESLTQPVNAALISIVKSDESIDLEDSTKVSAKNQEQKSAEKLNDKKKAISMVTQSKIEQKSDNFLENVAKPNEKLVHIFKPEVAKTKEEQKPQGVDKEVVDTSAAVPEKKKIEITNIPLRPQILPDMLEKPAVKPKMEKEIPKIDEKCIEIEAKTDSQVETKINEKGKPIEGKSKTDAKVADVTIKPEADRKKIEEKPKAPFKSAPVTDVAGKPEGEEKKNDVAPSPEKKTDDKTKDVAPYNLRKIEKKSKDASAKLDGSLPKIESKTIEEDISIKPTIKPQIEKSKTDSKPKEIGAKIDIQPAELKIDNKDKLASDKPIENKPKNLDVTIELEADKEKIDGKTKEPPKSIPDAGVASVPKVEEKEKKVKEMPKEPTKSISKTDAAITKVEEKSKKFPVEFDASKPVQVITKPDSKPSEMEEKPKVDDKKDKSDAKSKVNSSSLPALLTTEDKIKPKDVEKSEDSAINSDTAKEKDADEKLKDVACPTPTVLPEFLKGEDGSKDAPIKINEIKPKTEQKPMETAKPATKPDADKKPITTEMEKPKIEQKLKEAFKGAVDKPDAAKKKIEPKYVSPMPELTKVKEKTIPLSKIDEKIETILAKNDESEPKVETKASDVNTRPAVKSEAAKKVKDVKLKKHAKDVSNELKAEKGKTDEKSKEATAINVTQPKEPKMDEKVKGAPEKTIESKTKLDATTLDIVTKPDADKKKVDEKTKESPIPAPGTDVASKPKIDEKKKDVAPNSEKKIEDKLKEGVSKDLPQKVNESEPKVEEKPIEIDAAQPTVLSKLAKDKEKSENTSTSVERKPKGDEKSIASKPLVQSEEKPKQNPIKKAEEKPKSDVKISPVDITTKSVPQLEKAQEEKGISSKSAIKVDEKKPKMDEKEKMLSKLPLIPEGEREIKATISTESDETRPTAEQMASVEASRPTVEPSTEKPKYGKKMKSETKAKSEEKPNKAPQTADKADEEDIHTIVCNIMSGVDRLFATYF